MQQKNTRTCPILRERLATRIGPFCLFLLLGLPAYGDIAGAQDHPLLSRFPGSTIIDFEHRHYDQVFAASKPGPADGTWLTGRMTSIVYQAPPNTSTLQLYRNYQNALGNAGFTTTFACQKQECGRNFIRSTIDLTKRWVGQFENFMPNSARYLAAKRPGEQGDTWVVLLIHERNAQGTTIVRQEIIEPSEPRAFADLKATQLDQRTLNYDETRMAAGGTTNGQLSNVLNLEGKIDWGVFRLGGNYSAVEVFASQRKQLEEQGFQFPFACGRSQCGRNFIRQVVDLNGRVAKGGERWSPDSAYYLFAKYDTPEKKVHFAALSYLQPNGATVVRQLNVTHETPGFDQIKVSAESLSETIDNDGRVAVYGIYFDVDKADLKTESRPTLAQIARLLEMRPELALFVDGHTDDQGDESYNMELSTARATAVVSALVDVYGVDRSRLEPRGFGESKPTGDNLSPQGRQKNRRVELVAKDTAVSVSSERVQEMQAIGAALGRALELEKIVDEIGRAHV